MSKLGIFGWCPHLNTCELQIIALAASFHIITFQISTQFTLHIITQHIYISLQSYLPQSPVCFIPFLFPCLTFCRAFFVFSWFSYNNTVFCSVWMSLFGIALPFKSNWRYYNINTIAMHFTVALGVHLQFIQHYELLPFIPVKYTTKMLLSIEWAQHWKTIFHVILYENYFHILNVLHLMFLGLH